MCSYIPKLKLHLIFEFMCMYLDRESIAFQSFKLYINIPNPHNQYEIGTNILIFTD